MKRIFDVVVSSLLIVLTCPLMALTYLGTLVFIGKPAIFKQKRPGLHGVPFEIYKFRTMTNKKDNHGEPLPDHERMTAFGRFIRKMSLDELPQLFNVLKGDLSLVGPRPLLVKYLDLYTREQARRHNVRPGITGWAQVNGRNAISWEEKFDLDIWYVDHQSMLLDLKILWMTFMKVMISDGVTQSGHETTTEFTGSKNRIVIVGAGGQGREIVQLVHDINAHKDIWTIVGFIDDNPELKGRVISGYPVIGDSNMASSSLLQECCFVCAIGDSLVREKIVEKLKEINSSIKFATLIHPSSIVGNRTTIGVGTIIAANVTLTVDVTVGEQVLINYGCTIGHDCFIDCYATILPGSNLSGNVVVSRTATIGSAGVILPGKKVGVGAFVGAGAVVTKDVANGSTVVGVPAKLISKG